VAPQGTESDANYLATLLPHGWARRNKQGHPKGVEFLLDKHKKIRIQIFMKGEEIKSEKIPLLACWRTSSAPHFKCGATRVMSALASQ
jgi:hypothetical protein